MVFPTWGLQVDASDTSCLRHVEMMASWPEIDKITYELVWIGDGDSTLHSYQENHFRNTNTWDLEAVTGAHPGDYMCK